MTFLNFSEKYVMLGYETYRLTTLACTVLMLLIAVIGLYGNIISLIIFTKTSMRRSSINILLSALSVIDFFLLITAVVVFVVPNFNEIFKIDFFTRMYSAIILYLYPLALTVQTSSIWTFVLISVERYLAVCFPLTVNKYLTTKRTKYAELSIIFVSILYNFVRFWEFERHDDVPYSKYLLRADRTYFVLYFTTLYLITHFAIPFGLMLILNIAVARSIVVAQKQRQEMVPSGIAQMNQAPGWFRQNRTTCMIFMATALFALCNSFAFLLNIWEAFEPTLFDEDNRIAAYLLLDISNIAVILNCSTSFIVYLIFCRKYKQYFNRYHSEFCCWWWCRRKTPPNERKSTTDNGYYVTHSVGLTTRRQTASFTHRKKKVPKIVVNSESSQQSPSHLDGHPSKTI